MKVAKGPEYGLFICPRCKSPQFHVIVVDESKNAAESLLKITEFKYSFYLECAKCGYQIGYLCTSMRHMPFVVTKDKPRF